MSSLTTEINFTGISSTQLILTLDRMDDNKNQKFSVQHCVYTEPFIQLVH